MWTRISQRLGDPVFYRKRLRQAVRLVRPPRPPRPVTLDQLAPRPRSGSCLVVIAHPDDELFASGLILELGARGVDTDILCLTRGEGGAVGDGGREDLGERREAELHASAAALGAREVAFLGHRDPVGKPHRTYAPDVSPQALTDQLSTCFRARSPRLVITHGSHGEYWHPAHLLLHRAVFRALRPRHGRANAAILTFHAWQPAHPLPHLLNREDPADLTFDSLPHRDARLTALTAHRSQAEFFATLGGGSLEGFIDLTRHEAYRHHPV